MIALLAGLSVAQAYECFLVLGTCDWVNGTTSTYRIVIADFTSWQEDEIDLAADAWKAGSGRVNRGANFAFVRGTDKTTAGGLNNLTYEVFMKDQAWFDNLGFDSTTLAREFYTPFERDIVVNSDQDWVDELPSGVTGTEKPFGQTLTHEFGHWLGLDHEDTIIATMNSYNPLGGDISATRYRIGEDDFVGLEVAKGDASTGSNLMLHKFRRTGSGSSTEVWTGSDNGNDWSHCPGATLSGTTDHPGAIYSHITGTSTLTGVDVVWQLDPGSTCFSGTEYEVASASYTMSVGVPLEIRGGTWTIPSNTPPGSYRVCAKIDADDSVTESSEVDNNLRSEKTFTVESCP